ELFQGARNHRRNIVLLLATAAELLDRPDDFLEKTSRRKVRMPPQDIEQTGFAEFFPGHVHRLGDAIRVKYQRVTVSKPHFRDLATPLFKQSHDGGGRVQPLHLWRIRNLRAPAGAPEKCRQMSTIGIAELAA